MELTRALRHWACAGTGMLPACMLGLWSCLHDLPPRPEPKVPPVQEPPKNLDTVLHYPDSIIPFDLGAGWQLDAATWPGELGPSGEDGLQLLLQAAGASESVRLGTWEGTLSLFHAEKESSLVVPFRVQRLFSGFYPQAKSPQDYWDLVSKAQVVPMSQAGDQVLAQGLAVEVASKDSVASAHSRFTLRGDYNLEVHLRLPATVESGYTVAFFLSPEKRPLFFRFTTSTGFETGFEVFSPGAGIFFNAERGQNLVEAFGFQDRGSTPGIRLPNDVTFRFTREARTVSFFYRGAGEPAFREIQTWIYADDEELEEPLYLHFLVGVFKAPPGDLNVEWDRFVIRRGEAVFSP